MKADAQLLSQNPLNNIIAVLLLSQVHQDYHQFC